MLPRLHRRGADKRTIPWRCGLPGVRLRDRDMPECEVLRRHERERAGHGLPIRCGPYAFLSGMALTNKNHLLQLAQHRKVGAKC
eukprot:2542579-Rhodomonas_salina.1